MSSKIPYLVSLALLLMTMRASATTYYVDALNGSDEQDGLSAETAWSTLDSANAVPLGPGDTLLIKAGTSYTGQLKPLGSGTAEAPITIDMFGEGDKPRIDGAGYLAALHLLLDRSLVVIAPLVLRIAR